MTEYQKVIVAFSGGKDSLACVLHLLEQGTPKEKIELWHHDVDGFGETFMDWECTREYCRAVADHLSIPIFFSHLHGGFIGAMTKKDSRKQATLFEVPGNTVKFNNSTGDYESIPNLQTAGGTIGKPGTRMMFPMITSDLSKRWCSSELKIDVMGIAINNQSRFNHSNTLVVTGERAEESAHRSRYLELEPHRSDRRNGKLKRLVNHSRPILRWTTEDVWALIQRWGITAHPAYHLGWGRVSCKFCIFGSDDQFASASLISPEITERIAGYETLFGKTIKAVTKMVKGQKVLIQRSIWDVIKNGTPYQMDGEWVAQALSKKWYTEIKMKEWLLPKGAYGESCGPT